MNALPSTDAARTSAPTISTLGELRAGGYELRPLRDEIRANLLSRLASGEDPWPGLHGLEDTVVPQLERALIAGHELVLLGERGQGKTPLLRSLAAALGAVCPALGLARACDAPRPPPRRPAPGARRPRAGRAPVLPAHPVVPPPGPRPARRAAAHAAPPRHPIRREARHPGHLGRRPHRRRRPHEG